MRTTRFGGLVGCTAAPSAYMYIQRRRFCTENLGSAEECGHPIDLGIAAAVLQQPNEGTSTQTCNAAR